MQLLFIVELCKLLFKITLGNATLSECKFVLESEYLGLLQPKPYLVRIKNLKKKIFLFYLDSSIKTGLKKWYQF
jgi:hypothetical protein